METTEMPPGFQSFFSTDFPMMYAPGTRFYLPVSIGRLLVGVSGSHEELVVEEAPDKLYADWETN
jgi:hypothetical protein